MKTDFEIEVPCRHLVDSRSTLPCQSDMLAFMDAFGDLHMQRPLLQHHLALCIHLWGTQGNRVGPAVKRIIESNENFRMMVLTMSTGGSGVTGEVAKQGGEEIAIAGTFRCRRATGSELEACSPLRRRGKFLSCPPAIAQLVVGGALLRVLKHFVGFTDFLKSRFRLRLFTHVRMIFRASFR